LLNTLTGHTDVVLSFAEFPNGLLASGGLDAIKVWNLRDGRLLATFENSATLKILALPNRFLASSIIAKGISIWNLNGCIFNS
jgi:WD40 repeat protein